MKNVISETKLLIGALSDFKERSSQELKDLGIGNPQARIAKLNRDSSNPWYIRSRDEGHRAFYSLSTKFDNPQVYK